MSGALRTDAATVAEQVRQIASLMASGAWIVGVTENSLAHEWKIGIGSIRDRASEARRLVAHAYGDISDLRGSILLQLDTIARDTRKNEPRTAVSALVAIANIAGLIARAGDRATATIAKTLTPAERLAEIARIRTALNEAEAEAQRELATVDAAPQDEV